MPVTSISMPLLAKELAEQAGRIRTYRVRTFFAAILYVPAMVMLLFQNGHLDLLGRVDLVNTGIGRDMCDLLWATLQIAIYLFLPAMTAGAIAAEKENGTLHLLFLTDLSPWETILQKYLGRLIPFLTMVLLSLPIFAVGYAYGGMSQDAVAGIAYGQLITVLQVAAIALFCSAQCATTTGAIISSYFVGAGFYFTPYLLVALLYEAGGINIVGSEREIQQVFLSCFPTYVLSQTGTGLPDLVVRSIPILLSTAVFLLLARRSVVNYIFRPPRSVVSIFRRMDEVFASWNRHFGNVTVLADRATLPGDSPVSWREMHKRGLGRRHHQIRLLLALMIPLLFACVSLLGMGGSNEGLFLLVAAVTWLVCGIILLTNAASSIPSERSSQTLEVLLSTPIGALDIALDKIASLRRLAIVLSIPLLTLGVVSCIVSSEWGFRYRYFHERWTTPWLLFPIATIVGVRYLMWTGFACGLFLKNRTTAVITAIALSLILFAGLPVLVVFFAETVFGTSDSPLTVLLLLSPGIPIVSGLLPEIWSEFFRHWETAAFIIWFAVALKIQSSIRKRCLNHAPRAMRGF